MSALRDALEKLAGELEYDVAGAPAKIRALLAAEPAPDRQPSDAAVEAAAQAYYEHLGWNWDDLGGWDEDQRRERDHEESKAVILCEFGVALEAAYRVDAPRPLPTPDSIAVALFKHDQEAFGYQMTWDEAGVLRQATYLDRANALLALLNGSTS